MESVFYRGFWIDFLEEESKFELLLNEQRVGLFDTIEAAKKKVDEVINSVSKN